MAGVLKKGYLEVKTRSRLGSGYRRKYVVLQRNSSQGIKLVTIKETETATEGVEFLPLNGMWTVQDKTSRSSKRYPFELVIGSDVVMTFSCCSVTEREDWTESFRMLNRLSIHSPPVPTADMHPVTLERSLSSIEVGVSGPCLLGIQDASIVLYSEDGRSKLHHWSAGVVKKMTLEADQLVLLACRAGGDMVMEFRFNTDMETARHVMTSWNMAVLQSMAADPEKLNMISSFIQGSMHGAAGGGGASERGGKTGSLHRGLFGSSTKQKPKPAAEKDVQVRRAHSVTEKTTHAALRRSTSPEIYPLACNRLSSASQDSYTINAVNPSMYTDEPNSPPPVPPRAPRKPWSIGKDGTKNHVDDPDYSYIRDDEVETGGDGQANVGVERELEDLLRDIMEDNNRKRMQIADRPNHRILPAGEAPPIPRSRTFGHPGGTAYLMKQRQFFVDYGENKEPGDYLEPVPSKNPQSTQQMRRGNHVHSHSLPSSNYEPDSQAKPRSPNRHHAHNNTGMGSSHLASPPFPNARHKAGPSPRSFSTSDKPPSPPLPPLHPLHPTTTAAVEKSSPVLSTSTKADISPYAQTSNLRIELGVRPKPAADSGGGTNTLQPCPTSPSPPPLPPRSPIKQPRDRYHSASSTTSSNSSVNQRCPRCKGMKSSTKRSVSKTVSLNDPHHTKAHQAASITANIPRGSLPDLHHTSPIPENILGMQGRHEDSESSSTHSSNDTDVHTSSQSVASSRGGDKYSPKRLSTEEKRFSSTRSPTSPPPYLQVVEDQEPPPAKGGEKALDSTLEMLNSVVRDLENLESKVSEASSSGNRSPLKRTQEVRPTDIDAAIKQVQQVQNDLTLAKQEPKKPVDKGLPTSSPVTKSPPGSGGITRHKRAMTIHHSSSSSSANSSPSSQPGMRHRSNSQHFTNGFTPPPVYNAAPHVPPRSAVSLQQQPIHRQVYQQSSSPNIGIGHQSEFTSTYGHRHSMMRHNSHIGSTVFIHHLQDIKRTQC